MEYSFEEKKTGALYRNSLTAGVRRVKKTIDPLIRSFVFNRARGEVWIKHNVEEVRNFEFFLLNFYFSHNEKLKATI